MKKYLILAVVTLLAVALSACSGNVKSNDTSAENTTVQVSTSVYETVQTSNAELPKIYNPTNVEIRDNEDENKVIIESSQIEYVCLLDKPTPDRSGIHSSQNIHHTHTRFF